MSHILSELMPRYGGHQPHAFNHVELAHHLTRSVYPPCGYGYASARHTCSEHMYAARVGAAAGKYVVLILYSIALAELHQEPLYLRVSYDAAVLEFYGGASAKLCRHSVAVMRIARVSYVYGYAQLGLYRVARGLCAPHSYLLLGGKKRSKHHCGAPFVPLWLQ